MCGQHAWLTVWVSLEASQSVGKGVKTCMCVCARVCMQVPAHLCMGVCASVHARAYLRVVGRWVQGRSARIMHPVFHCGPKRVEPHEPDIYVDGRLG